jgi:hypothetical protein
MPGTPQTQPEPGTATQPVLAGQEGEGGTAPQVHWWDEGADRPAPTAGQQATSGWPSPWGRSTHDTEVIDGPRPAPAAPGDHADTIRFDHVPGGPGGYGGAPFGSPAGPPPPPRRRHRWLDMAIAAVVAAVVAAGTTAGVMATDDSPTSQTMTSSSSSPAGSGPGPVAQAAGQPVD